MSIPEQKFDFSGGGNLIDDGFRFFHYLNENTYGLIIELYHFIVITSL